MTFTVRLPPGPITPELGEPQGATIPLTLMVGDARVEIHVRDLEEVRRLAHDLLRAYEQADRPLRSTCVHCQFLIEAGTEHDIHHFHGFGDHVEVGAYHPGCCPCGQSLPPVVHGGFDPTWAPGGPGDCHPPVPQGRLKGGDSYD